MEIRPVPEFPNYGVDQHGNVYRITRWRSGKPRDKPTQLKPILNKRLGYYVCSLYTGSGRRPKIRYLHHVVASAWLGPKPLGHHVHHKDEDKFNNHPSNLVFVEAKRHRAMHRPFDDATVRKILLSEKTARELAEEYGYSQVSIRNIWSGRTYRKVFDEVKAAGLLIKRR